MFNKSNYKNLFEILDKLLELKERTDFFYAYNSNKPLYNKNMKPVVESLQFLE